MDFVTVCFNKDLPQLKLQAVSMSKFLNDFPVGNIFIVVNDENFEYCQTYIQNNVLPYYRQLREQVKIINGDLLVNSMFRYFNQMLLKLLAANLVESQHYCILDAKTFLLAPWSNEDIYHDGKLIIGHQPISPEWLVGYRKCFEYFNLDIDQHKPISQQSPFFAITDFVKTMVNLPDFCTTFRRQLLIEFPLIHAATVAYGQDLDKFYWSMDTGVWTVDFENRYKSGIWVIDCEMLNQQNNIEWYILYTKNKMLSTSIHRDCFYKLNEKNIQVLKSILVDRQLLTVNEADNLFIEMQQLNVPKPHQFA